LSLNSGGGWYGFNVPSKIPVEIGIVTVSGGRTSMRLIDYEVITIPNGFMLVSGKWVSYKRHGLPIKKKNSA
jgi:hypothetical protein